jgi:quercetin dioxygenase-like cupin family protein
MRSWDLTGVEARPHEPQILSDASDARVVLLRLPAGEELQEHEVHEKARLFVVAGELEVETPDGERVAGRAGMLFEFEPGERRSVSASSDARLLLVLSPWPGDGHPGALSLAEKASVRERAAEHQPG